MEGGVVHSQDMETAMCVAKGIVSCYGIIKEVDLVCKYMQNVEMMHWSDVPLEPHFVLRALRDAGEVKCFEYTFDEMPNKEIPRLFYAPKTAEVVPCKY